MFSFGRRDEVSPTQQVLKLSLSSPKGITPRFRGRQGFLGSPRNARIMEVDDAEAGAGVEVCLGNPPIRGGGPASPLETREPPHVPIRADAVVSMQAETLRYKTVHQSQGALRAPPVASLSSTASPSIRHLQDHRIPLFGGGHADLAYDDVVALLENVHISSEISLVKLELDLLQKECAALERDQQLLLRQEHQLEVVDDPILPLRSPRPSNPTTNITAEAVLSLQQLLESATLTNVERERLQALRGNCWTFHIEQPKLREAFLQKCGAKLSEVLKASSSTVSQQQPRRAILLPPADCLTLGPHNCRAGGAAIHVRQLQMTCESIQGQQLVASPLPNSPRGRQHQQHPLQSAPTPVAGFVMSSDTGKAQSWGRLPASLFKRLQQQRQSKEKIDGSQPLYSSGDIEWLTTGPMGTYVCKFVSGELWWRLFQDADLLQRMQSWNIHQVVFGPCTQTENGVYPSWAVIGQDGRVAWKNIPRSLETKLLSRQTSLPAVDSISLGAGGSYFVRFRDLTMDYCVSAEMALVCDYIHANGGTVTDMIFHAESTEDFIIRHSELK